MSINTEIDAMSIEDLRAELTESRADVKNAWARLHAFEGFQRETRRELSVVGHTLVGLRSSLENETRESPKVQRLRLELLSILSAARLTETVERMLTDMAEKVAASEAELAPLDGEHSKPFANLKNSINVSLNALVNPESFPG